MAHGGFLPAHAHFLLDQACMVIHRAFDAVPFLVGSALERRDYRDVDVRVILDDDRYDAWFGTEHTSRANPLWSLLCSAVSLQLGHMTGLPVDFQVQRFTTANAHYKGMRDPLGIFPTPREES